MAIQVGGPGRLVPGLIEQLGKSVKEMAPTDSEAKVSFVEMLGNFIGDVNDLQKESARLQEAFMAGEPVELHQVMIKAEKAGLATDLLLEIRNRLMKAYDDLARMPL